MLKFYLFLLNRNRNERNGGYISILAMIFAFFVMALSALYGLLSTNNRIITDSTTDRNNAFFQSESGLNDRAELFARSLSNFSLPTGTSPQSGADGIPDCFNSALTQGTGNFACQSSVEVYETLSATLSGGQRTTDRQEYKNFDTRTYILDRTTYRASNLPLMLRLSSDPFFPGVNAEQYLYEINSTSRSSRGGADVQLSYRQRIQGIPVFQFNLFTFDHWTLSHVNDSTDKLLDGRYHINGNLILSVRNRGNNDKTILGGNWTVGGDLFLGSKPLDDLDKLRGYSVSSKVFIDSPTGRIPLPSFVNQGYTDKVAAKDMAGFGQVLQTAATGMSPLKVPPLGFLRRTGSGGSTGMIYGKADLRLFSNPFNYAVPFDLSVLQTGTSAQGTATACTDLSSDRENRLDVKCRDYTKGQLLSLNAPVMIVTRNSTEASTYCPAGFSGAPTLSLTSTQRDLISRAIRLAVATSNYPLYLDDMQTVFTDGSLKDRFSLLLDNISGLTAEMKSTLLKSTPQKIAALSSGCFLVAPVQLSRFLEDPTCICGEIFFNRRTLPTFYSYNTLHVNLQSLAVWNRDGLFVNFPDEDRIKKSSVANNALIAALSSSTNSAAGMVFVPSTTDTLAAADRTDGGLVFWSGTGYGDSDYPVNSTTLLRQYGSKDDPLGESPYAFIFNGGAKLPAPLTLASDQKIFVQGDFNSVTKQPAAVMADDFTLLSNACLATPGNQEYLSDSSFDYTLPLGSISCGHRWALTDDVDATKIKDASNTTFNGGILVARNPISATNTSNYPISFMEDWSGKTLSGRTAFVISGKQLETQTSIPEPGDYSYKMPSLTLVYETDFNDWTKLPPATPRALAYQSGKFRRVYR